MKTSAPAKVILLGEHTALYGNPVLTLAIDLRSYVTVSKRDDDEVVITAPGLGLEKVPVREQKGTNLIKKAVGMVDGGYDIEIKSDIPIASGLGSSASIASALMKALKQDSDMRVIANDAWHIENEVHSKSSGVDPFAVTYGGLCLYQSGEAEKLEVEEYPNIVIAHTGIESDTGDIVLDVDRLKEEQGGDFEAFLAFSQKAVLDGKDAIINQDWKALGNLMNLNHEMLRGIGVSCKELEELTQAARDAGAYGAKLAGAGRGGIMVALVDENTENDVSKALSKMGAKIIESKISSGGVRIE